MKRHPPDAAYYQSLHDSHPAFQNNNWLNQDLETLVGWGGRSLLELGCGNGLFLDQAAESWEVVTGVDWARSPVLDQVLARRDNVRFVQADILEWRPAERFDIVASADFLEHLPPQSLVAAVRGFHAFGRYHYHRIACYDDGHSHLSILPPETWLAVFEEAVPGEFRLLTTEARKGDATKQVITIGATP